MTSPTILGIDIGGSGIKGAICNTLTGELLTERFRLPTPQPATPEAMIAITADVVQHFNWTGPIGCGFPAVIKDGKVYTAANIAPEWIGVSLTDELAHAVGVPVQ
jgi:polyphosphate glucokinase